MSGKHEDDAQRSDDGAAYVTGSGAPPEPERTLERAIGTHIRDLRQRFHLSVAHLAGAASISTGMMSKIENGQISPSLSTLQALAQALNVPITNLFSAFEEKRDCSFVQGGAGRGDRAARHQGRPCLSAAGPCPGRRRDDRALSHHAARKTPCPIPAFAMPAPS